jgi:hypothetical protein
MRFKKKLKKKRGNKKKLCVWTGSNPYYGLGKGGLIKEQWMHTPILPRPKIGATQAIEIHIAKWEGSTCTQEGPLFF